MKTKRELINDLYKNYKDKKINDDDVIYTIYEYSLRTSLNDYDELLDDFNELKHNDFIFNLYDDYVLNGLSDNDIQDILMAYCINNNLTCNSIYDDFDNLMNYFIKLKGEKEKWLM